MKEQFYISVYKCYNSVLCVGARMVTGVCNQCNHPADTQETLLQS